MVRWVVAACVLMAGCLGAAPEPGEGSAGAASAAAPPDHDVPEQESNGDEGALGSPEPEAWYLHKMLTCTGEPCNCGSTVGSMDRADSPDDCDGNGGRPFLESQEGFLLAETWPAAEPFTDWPVGTLLEGTLYVTTDVESSYDLYFVLASGSVDLARTAVTRATARDGGFGLTYTAIPFEATLTAALPMDAKIRLDLYLDFQQTATSYFVGYDGDHASSFTLRAP